MLQVLPVGAISAAIGAVMPCTRHLGSFGTSLSPLLRQHEEQVEVLQHLLLIRAVLPSLWTQRAISAFHYLYVFGHLRLLHYFSDFFSLSQWEKAAMGSSH